MKNMDRRSFVSLAGATAAGFLLPTAVVASEAAEAAVHRPRYPSSVLWGLPNKSPKLAWTVDDGFGEQALHNYIDFAEATQTRLTFFITSNYHAWRTMRRRLLPLVETGQVQLANHTKSHANLTKLSGSGIRYELTECAKFIHGEFGVKPAPIFRPPYGYYDDRVRREAAAVGFRTPVMWFGSLGDGGGVTNRTRLNLAKKWMTAGRIVIAHANQVTPPADLLKIHRMIESRGLATVTLNDVWRP
jgi:peptidoglycan-N-acetylglucosamine deacetylase